jgi:ribulose-5-phosphate 4-epimerase/fuculose-1-phosphate aldolase
MPESIDHDPTSRPSCTTTPVGLRPVAHVAGFLGAGVPVFDIRDAIGSETSMLVDEPGLGDLLAGALMSAPVVLMRGHGATVVGNSLEQALYRSVYAVQNALMQAEAMRMGTVNFLSDGECRQAAATIDRSLDRVWDNWVQQLCTDPVSRQP